LVGCGILHKEVDFLLAKNRWNVETEFLDSALHNYLKRLSSELDGALDRDERAGRDTVVFYGACHPQMDNILQRHHTLRTHGQNCIVMLLGHERFHTELAKGAYFLLEDWALTWKPMLTDAFGDNQEVLREIFRGSHQCMIAIRTPCSSDFATAAAAAAAYVDLPLQWLDVDLDHLESILADAIARKRHQTAAERP
jgi:hypothetical protein